MNSYKTCHFLMQTVRFHRSIHQFFVLHKTFSLPYEYFNLHELLYTNYKCKCIDRGYYVKWHPIKISYFLKRTSHSIPIAQSIYSIPCHQYVAYHLGNAYLFVYMVIDFVHFLSHVLCRTISILENMGFFFLVKVNVEHAYAKTSLISSNVKWQQINQFSSSNF